MSLEDLIRDFTNRRTWALVGANNNPRKYGNKIFRSLRGAGYKVYAVNNRESSVDGEPASAPSRCGRRPTWSSRGATCALSNASMRCLNSASRAAVMPYGPRAAECRLAMSKITRQLGNDLQVLFYLTALQRATKGGQLL